MHGLAGYQTPAQLRDTPVVCAKPCEGCGKVRRLLHGRCKRCRGVKMTPTPKARCADCGRRAAQHQGRCSICDRKRHGNYAEHRCAGGDPHCQATVMAAGEICDDCRERLAAPPTGDGAPCLWCLKRVNPRHLMLCETCSAEYAERAKSMPREEPRPKPDDRERWRLKSQRYRARRKAKEAG